MVFVCMLLSVTLSALLKVKELLDLLFNPKHIDITVYGFCLHASVCNIVSIIKSGGVARFTF